MSTHTKSLADLLRDLAALVDGMPDPEVIDLLATPEGVSSIVYRPGVPRSGYVEQLDKIVAAWASDAQLWLDVQDYDDRINGMSAGDPELALARTARAIGERRALAAQARWNEHAEEMGK